MFRLCYRLLNEPFKFDVPIEMLPVSLLTSFSLNTISTSLTFNVVTVKYKSSTTKWRILQLLFGYDQHRSHPKTNSIAIFECI